MSEDYGGKHNTNMLTYLVGEKQTDGHQLLVFFLQLFKENSQTFAIKISLDYSILIGDLFGNSAAENILTFSCIKHDS